jgi:hypothetical protein
MSSLLDRLVCDAICSSKLCISWIGVDGSAVRDLFAFSVLAACGKTCIAHEFALRLGYAAITLPLYSDMTARDLLQVRCRLRPAAALLEVADTVASSIGVVVNFIPDASIFVFESSYDFSTLSFYCMQYFLRFRHCSEEQWMLLGTRAGALDHWLLLLWTGICWCWTDSIGSLGTHWHL